MAKGTCSVDTCERKSRRRDWCAAHYGRWLASGDVRADKPIQAVTRGRGPVCTYEGCEKPHLALGYCAMHHARLRKNGSPAIKTLAPRVCKVAGCDGRTESRQLCAKHYARWRTHGDPTISLKPRRAGRTCSVDGCDRMPTSRGWCRTHYSRFHKSGDVQANKPIRPAKWTTSCEVGRCKRRAEVTGLCMKHYQRRRHLALMGDPDRAEALRRRAREAHAAAFVRDPDFVRARHKAWRMGNPDAARAIDERKRSRRRTVLCLPFTLDQLDDRMRYWGNRCWICGGPFEAIDHVKPVAKGGANILANLRPICRSDNSRKRDRWPVPRWILRSGDHVSARRLPSWKPHGESKPKHLDAAP